MSSTRKSTYSVDDPACIMVVKYFVRKYQQIFCLISDHSLECAIQREMRRLEGGKVEINLPL